MFGDTALYRPLLPSPSGNGESKRLGVSMKSRDNHFNSLKGQYELLAVFRAGGKTIMAGPTTR